MEFGYFTLSDNHYPNSPRSARERSLRIRLPGLTRSSCMTSARRLSD